MGARLIALIQLEAEFPWEYGTVNPFTESAILGDTYTEPIPMTRPMDAELRALKIPIMKKMV